MEQRENSPTRSPLERLREHLRTRVEAFRRLEAQLDQDAEAQADSTPRFLANFLDENLKEAYALGGGEAGVLPRDAAPEAREGARQDGPEGSSPSTLLPRKEADRRLASFFLSVTSTGLLREPSTSTSAWTPTPTPSLLLADEKFWTDFPGDPGATVLDGRYEILSLIACGGSSRIFRGLDRRDGAPVAVKVVPPVLSAAVARALEVSRKLRHPNVISVTASGSVGDRGLYLAMPLLRGTTLSNLLPPLSAGATRSARGGSLRRALFTALRRACRGVAHAHECGIVHRDLKPSNIQVEPDGRTVVLDWGLACPAGESQEDEIVGTPVYMSPEQLQGGAATCALDVHALGIILYQILTGVHPFGPAKDLASIRFRILRDPPPPPSLLVPDLPPALDEVVLRCLAKDPAARYGSASELLELLEDVPWDS